MLRPLALASLLAVGLLAPLRPAFASDEIQPRGVQLEFMPGAAICLPGTVKCDLAGFGATGVFVGGSATIGYRPLRHVMIGASYSGAGFRMDYEPFPDRTYAPFAHQHGVYAIFRANIPVKRWDFLGEVGAGWSMLILPLDVGGDRIYSHGFGMRLAPGFVRWFGEQFFFGAKADFNLNFHGKRCRDDSSNCMDRREDREREQIPFHIVIPGLLFGFVV